MHTSTLCNRLTNHFKLEEESAGTSAFHPQGKAFAGSNAKE